MLNFDHCSGTMIKSIERNCMKKEISLKIHLIQNYCDLSTKNIVLPKMEYTNILHLT